MCHTTTASQGRLTPSATGFFRWAVRIAGAAILGASGLSGASSQGNYSTPYTFGTLAGSAGVSGRANGTGSAARFANPAGVAVGGGGNIYVADIYNAAIRKISPSGVVTTLAGGASAGKADGAGGAAQFFNPQGIAVDAVGNVYVADYYNARVRRVTPAGVVTTVPGTVAQPGTTGGLLAPTGVAVDRSGNLYVSDASHAIYKVTPDGTLSTLAGSAEQPGFADGTGAAARFHYPYGLAVDSAGTIYVADTENNAVRKVTPAGVVTTLAGGHWGYADGVGAGAQFSTPNSVAVDDAGNVYVTAGAIRRITPSGVVTTLAGGPNSGSADGTGGGAMFNYPDGLAIDSAGNLYVADYFNNTVRKGTLAGPEVANSGGRIVNLSIMTALAPGEGTFSLGVVVGGSGTAGNKTLLVRAAGPSLVSFGVNNGLPHPKIDLIGDGGLVATNRGWAGDAALRAAFDQVGAFAYIAPSSADAALLQTGLPAGTYHVTVSDTGGASGSVLAEIYDAAPAGAAVAATPRLINVSVLKQIGSSLAAGFVIGGTGNVNVLIRAVGPGLTQFGVVGALTASRVELIGAGGKSLAVNTAWGGGDGLKAAFTKVGAFALSDPNSNDAALLINLAPGSYSAQVTGVGGVTGMALVEVYEMP